MMKRAARILAGLALVLIGIWALFSQGAALGIPLKSLEKEWTFSQGELRDLQILSEDQVNVIFRESADSSQSVYVKGKVPGQVAEAIGSTRLEAGRLVLDLRHPGRFFPDFRIGLHWDQPDEVIVTLAPGYELDNLKVHIDSGSMDISGIAAKTADFASDSGSMKLSGIAGSQIRVSSDSGNVELHNIDAGSLDVGTDSGRLSGASIKADTSIELDSGNVTLDGVTGPVSIRADSGNIRLLKDDPSDAEIRTDSGNVYIRLPASFAGSLDLKTDSGRITAPDAKNETRDRITVRTDSGNIEIEQED